MDPRPDTEHDDEQVVALLQAARTQDRAPARLRARVERERTVARPKATKQRTILLGGLGGAIAAAALALALILPAGGPGAPSVAQAAALGFRPAVLGPPAIQGPKKLGVNVDDVYFPKWDGWVAVGQRVDRLGGRPAVTVYYARGGATVAYTIVGVPALPLPHAQTLKASWLTVHAQHLSGHEVVSWLRDGDTCILSSRQLPAQALAQLASEDGSHGTI